MDPKDSNRPSRRRLLQGGIASAALVATASVVALVRTGGYEVEPERARGLRFLEPWQFVLLQHVARRVCAPDDPSDVRIPSPDAVDAVGFMDEYIAAMPRALQTDLGRLFGYVEHVAPLRIGLLGRFTRLAPADQDRVLSSLESARESLLRGGFDGLKSLVFMGYYRDPRTWSILGYDGPLVGRPPGGW